MKGMSKNPRVVARKLKGRRYLVPVHEELDRMRKVFELNELGWFIWRRLEEAEDLGGLAGLIMDRFDVDSKTAFADARAFMDELVRVGALIRDGDSDQEA